MENDAVPYRSIACSLYDELEALATKRERCRIEFLADGAPELAEGRISDLFAKDGAEYLKLDSGRVIRLDRLVGVNGIPMNQKQC
jgi:Rho-binding antiterminator